MEVFASISLFHVAEGDLLVVASMATTVSGTLGSQPATRSPGSNPSRVMFSSGTTGKPKCIVHNIGGTLIQHLKEHQLHTDLKRDDHVGKYHPVAEW